MGNSTDECRLLKIQLLCSCCRVTRIEQTKMTVSVILQSCSSGGVGTAATQLCKSVPNVTVFGTASASKHDLIRKLGVDYPIDYRTQDYAVEVRKIQPNGENLLSAVKVPSIHKLFVSKRIGYRTFL